MTSAVRALEARDRAAVVALSLRAWAPVFASLERVLGESGVYAQLHPDWRVGQRRVLAMVETGGDPGHARARHTYQRAGFTELPVSRYFKTL